MINNESNIPSTKNSQNFKIKEIKDFINVQKLFSNLLSENHIKYKRIGDLDTGKYYKYMDLETALRCLGNKTLRFVEPSMWADKYESRFYTADFENVLKKRNESEICPIIYSSCFTRKRNNEAAWKIYTYGKTGLGARCIEFMLNKKKFREQILSNLKDCTIYEGNVSYLEEEKIDTLHKKNEYINREKVTNQLYHCFFDEFDLEKYLNLMLIKRDTFEHEQESRIMIVPNIQKSEKGEEHTDNGKIVYGNILKINNSDVRFDWGQVIEEVRYDDSCTDIEIQILNNAVRNAINFKGTEEEWEKNKCFPHYYPIYGKRTKIKIQ